MIFQLVAIGLSEPAWARPDSVHNQKSEAHELIANETVGCHPEHRRDRCDRGSRRIGSPRSPRTLLTYIDSVPVAAVAMALFRHL